MSRFEELSSKGPKEPVSIAPRIARYRDTKKIMPAFNALSIGSRCGQVALVPLDDSNPETAEMIAVLLNKREALMRLFESAKVVIAQTEAPGADPQEQPVVYDLATAVEELESVFGAL
jgi:hypothetical protein